MNCKYNKDINASPKAMRLLLQIAKQLISLFREHPALVKFDWSRVNHWQKRTFINSLCKLSHQSLHRHDFLAALSCFSLETHVINYIKTRPFSQTVLTYSHICAFQSPWAQRDCITIQRVGRQTKDVNFYKYIVWFYAAAWKCAMSRHSLYHLILYFSYSSTYYLWLSHL